MPPTCNRTAQELTLVLQCSTETRRTGAKASLLGLQSVEDCYGPFVRYFSSMRLTSVL